MWISYIAAEDLCICCCNQAVQDLYKIHQYAINCVQVFLHNTRYLTQAPIYGAAGVCGTKSALFIFRHHILITYYHAEFSRIHFCTSEVYLGHHSPIGVSFPIGGSLEIQRSSGGLSAGAGLFCDFRWCKHSPSRDVMISSSSVLWRFGMLSSQGDRLHSWLITRHNPRSLQCRPSTLFSFFIVAWPRQTRQFTSLCSHFTCINLFSLFKK